MALSRRFIIILFTLLMPFSVRAEEANPLFWEVKGPEASVYIFGSIHMMKPGVKWMTPDIADAFNRSQALWLEIGDDIHDMRLINRMMNKHCTLSEPTMSKGLTKAELRKLDALLAPAGLTAEELSYAKKGRVAMMLSMIQMKEFGFKTELGIDEKLFKLARQANKPIYGFETLEQQMRMLCGDDETGLATLREGLKHADEAKAIINKLFLGWSTGNESAIIALMQDLLKNEQPEQYKAMITDRNRNWEPQIEKFINDKKNIFITVGAAHLVGTDGIIAYLQNKGYNPRKLTRVPLPASH